MTDHGNNDLVNELKEAEKVESTLTRLFASLQPPFGAKDRLLAKLSDGFHESQLTLDDAGPYSFAEAARLAQADQHAGSDLLAAGLEEEPIEDELDDDEA